MVHKRKQQASEFKQRPRQGSQQNLYNFCWTEERQMTAVAEPRRTERKIARTCRLSRVALQNYMWGKRGWTLPRCHFAQPNQCWALSRSFTKPRIGWTRSKAEEQSFETRWSGNDSAVILTDLVRSFTACFKRMIPASGKLLLESLHCHWAARLLG